MLVGTLHKAIMTPLLPNTMVMSQTDMEPAVEERLPWQKITISVAQGWPITPILAVSIVPIHSYNHKTVPEFDYNYIACMSACIKFKIKLFYIIIRRANNLRNTPSRVTEARPMHIVATVLQESSATGYPSGVCLSLSSSFLAWRSLHLV